MYFVETIHGVVVDVCNNLPLALAHAKIGSTSFRVIPARVYSIEGRTRKYHS